MTLERKVVVVTGASAGVGRAVVQALADAGAHVGMIARGEEGLAGAHDDVVRRGARGHAVECDVADWAGVDAAASEIEQALGAIDVWINVAMTSVFAPFWDIAPDEFERVTKVTYLGYTNGTRAALARMRPRDRGTIVQVGSALAYRGIPLQSAYCGAKHAIQGFSESVRCELMHEHSNVRISQVMLPAVNTPQFDWVLSRLKRRAQPVPPIFQPELIAHTILRAAEHPKREYWVTWITARTVLLNKVMPGVLDHVLARNGFDSQQTDQPARRDRASDLWEPVDAGVDAGAHGRFDERATVTSWWERARDVARPLSPVLQPMTEAVEEGLARVLIKIGT